MDEFYKNGLKFGCTRCSACCRYESGYVFLSKADLIRLCSLSKMTEQDFLVRYCKSVNFGLAVRISLIEKDNKDCIFWGEDGCTVYEARPLQCRTYPFWPQLMDAESWRREQQSCPGMGQGKLYTMEEIEALMAARDREPLIDLKGV